MPRNKRRHHTYLSEEPPISAINATPLVDVMLVLLIIFLITIPVVLNTVPLNLPRARSHPTAAATPQVISIAVDAEGNLYWNGALLANQADFQRRIQHLVSQNPQAMVWIYGDQAARFHSIGNVLTTLQQAGIERVSFITDPSDIK